MANTLTGLIGTIYKAADTVARELVGFIPAVFKDSSADEVAKDQTITYPIVATRSAADITPAATGPNPSGETLGTGSMTISKSRSVTFPWNGEEAASIKPVYEKVLEDQFAQAMRTLVNEIEVDLYLAAKRGASRAYGTAGTTPFGTAANFSDFAELLKILKDNGAPTSDLHLVLNTTASTKILSVQSSLFKANEAGADSLLRTGRLGRVEGFDLHESAGITTHVKGTGSGYLVDLVAGYVAGDTTVHVDTGTGTLLAGDHILFQDDTNKYVINTGFAGDGDGDIVIGKPGLRAALADNKTVTIGANYLGSWGFDRNAIHLLTRLPLMPPGGDSADDSIVVTDPLSGLSFQVNLYRQYHQVSFEVGIAWGVKAVKSDFIATLLG
jgi:hypothetical protein